MVHGLVMLVFDQVRQLLQAWGPLLGLVVDLCSFRLLRYAWRQVRALVSFMVLMRRNQALGNCFLTRWHVPSRVAIMVSLCNERRRGAIRYQGSDSSVLMAGF